MSAEQWAEVERLFAGASLKAGAAAGESHPSENSRELPRAYSVLGEVYGRLGQPTKSRRWYRLPLAEWEKAQTSGLHLPEIRPEIEQARRGAQLVTPPADSPSHN